MSNKPIYVFLPAYNEGESVDEVIDELKRLELDLNIFVIDDGSRDETTKKAWEAGVNIMKHPVNLGGGAAIRTAFTFAALKDVDYIVTLDGDGQHDPKEIVSIIDAAENGADLVVGSRFLKRQNIEMPRYRYWGIKFFSWLVSKVVKKRVTDATSCYRAYNMELVKKVLPELTEDQYYGLETLIKMGRNGARIVEVPVSSKPRRNGKSKKGVIRYGYNLVRTLVKSLYEMA